METETKKSSWWANGFCLGDEDEGMINFIKYVKSKENMTLKETLVYVQTTEQEKFIKAWNNI